MAGIAAVFWGGAGSSVPLPNLLAAVGTATCFALALVVAKGGPEMHLAAVNAVGMLVGAAILFVLSRIGGEALAIPVLPATWIALLHLAVPGSVGGFGLMLFLLNRLPASVVSYQAVLTPIVAIALSAWLLGERLSWGLAVGAALVIVGVYVGVLSVDRPRSPM